MMTEQRSTSRNSARRPRIVIGADCLDRLEALAEGTILRDPDLADRLIGELVPVKIDRVSTAVLYGSLALAGVEA